MRLDVFIRPEADALALVDVAEARFAQEKPVNSAIDFAYRAKYGDSRDATVMVSEPARSTRIRLAPR